MVSRCPCHSVPDPWCPNYPLPDTDSPETGVMVFADYPGECGICGAGFEEGAQVVALPAPAWSHPMGHLTC